MRAFRSVTWEQKHQFKALQIEKHKLQTLCKMWALLESISFVLLLFFKIFFCIEKITFYRFLFSQFNDGRLKESMVQYFFTVRSLIGVEISEPCDEVFLK